MNFLAKRQKWLLRRCYSKSGLQVSCVMYDAEKKKVKLLNATPDFVIKSSTPDDDTTPVLSVGEIESSPYLQMITASLGHISYTLHKILIRNVSKEKIVNLYLNHNELGLKVHTDEAYVGDIEIKALTTVVYSFTSAERLHNLLKKIVSVITFIYDDYETRMSEFDWPTDIPEDPNPVLRQSERKRKGSQSPTPAKSYKH